MTENKLVMPKQTGQLDAFISSLSLFYYSYKKGEEWLKNEDFKKLIQLELPYLSEGAQDGPYLVKQSELVRYFGLAYYDYKERRTRITREGIAFYEAYLSKNKEKQIDIIMEAIFNLSFGRNNSAIKSSDTDIDPPKLFLRSILDLEGVSRKDLAYLLYVINNLKVEYTSAIIEFRKTRSEREIIIPEQYVNKYSDVKFTVLLTALGITVDSDNNKYQISDFVLRRYEDRIRNLSIYNRTPDIILSLDENLFDFEESEGILVPSGKQNKILTSFVYDISSNKFNIQNNREPVAYQRGGVTRYKTNARIAKTALDLANYVCEHDNQHKTFISKLGKPYMEAHHLIPMQFQRNFSTNIDRVENIISVCPTCHSAIHFGSESVRLEMLKHLYDIQIPKLKKVGLGIPFGELYSKYYK